MFGSNVESSSTLDAMISTAGGTTLGNNGDWSSTEAKAIDPEPSGAKACAGSPILMKFVG